MLLTNAAVRNRTTVLVLIVLIAFAGIASYVTLPRESAPDVQVPYVLVTTTQDGVSPEDVENNITREIEKELAGLKGLKEMTSTSAEGVSTIALEFLPGIEIDDALQRVRDKVDIAKPELPDDADEPLVNEINVAEFPIMMVNVSGPISPVRLKEIAEELEEAIESVPGVLGVDVLGALEREIRIEMDQDRIAAYGLTLEELLRLVPSENINRSAGALETEGTKFNIRVPAEFERPDDVDHLLLAVRDGKPVYLDDVASVNYTFKDRVTYARLDGQESITLAIRKRVGANIVKIAEAVKAIVAEARKIAPAGVSFELTMDQSKDIDMMLSDLENNILTALVLVVGVLVLFMGLRSSMIVALAIPLSMLASLAVIQMLGITLNMVVLFSLILALGMLVDNAIVIVENIYRHMEMGHSRVQAAMKGTAEVAWPVITSTATTLAAFSPMLFWPGIMGDFMKYLPLTVIIVLSCSLFVAMIVSPVACSVLGGGRTSPKRRKMEGRFVRGYRGLLETSLRHRRTTICLAVLVLAGIIVVYSKRGAGMELFPKIDPRQAVVNIRAPQGTNIKRTDEIARFIEQRVEQHRTNAKGGFAQIDHVVANVGSAGGFSIVGRAAGPHVANVTIIFPDYKDRRRLSADVLADIRASITDIGGAEIKVEEQKKGPPIGAPIAIRIIGKDLETLEALSERARALIEDTPNLINLRSDLEAERPELAFVVDRDRAKMLGVNTAVVANFIKAAVFGTKVGSYRQFNDEYDITIRLPESQRRSIRDLLRLRVPNRQGKAVPLSSVGSFVYRPGLGNIHRIDQDRAVTLTADTDEGRNTKEVLADVQKRLAKLDLPAGYHVRYAGEKEETEKAVRFLGYRALPIALLVIVMILVAQFNTLTVPLIVLCTVVLSTIGVLVGLLAFDMPFGIIMTGIGVISLAGVVVNNAIVLLDYTRRLQRKGMGLMEAAVQAGVTRLRPVLLTATTTILGLVPMITGISLDIHSFGIAFKSESSQWWRSLAVAVVFGLGFATLLTLVVVPALYVSLYRLAERLGLGGLRKSEEDVQPAAAPGVP